MAGGDDSIDVAASRRRMFGAVAVVVPLALAAWLGLYFLTPVIDGAASPVERLGFAAGWIGMATFLCLLTGIEAVAHERLFTPAINPLAGRESPRLRINLRYLQNTLEQWAILVPALLLLAWYAEDGGQLRAVTASAVVWIALRFVFWIGYHHSPEMRTPGLVGMAMSMLVLAYGVARFGHDLAGWPGAATPLLIFAGIEAYLVYMSLRAGAETKGPD